MTENKTTDLGLIRIRSSRGLLDGLTGKGVMYCDNKLIRLTLDNDAPQADLEKDDEVLIPIEAITFLQTLK